VARVFPPRRLLFPPETPAVAGPAPWGALTCPSQRPSVLQPPGLAAEICSCLAEKKPASRPWRCAQAFSPAGTLCRKKHRKFPATGRGGKLPLRQRDCFRNRNCFSSFAEPRMPDYPERFRRGPPRFAPTRAFRVASSRHAPWSPALPSGAKTFASCVTPTSPTFTSDLPSQFLHSIRNRLPSEEGRPNSFQFFRTSLCHCCPTGPPRQPATPNPPKANAEHCHLVFFSAEQHGPPPSAPKWFLKPRKL